MFHGLYIFITMYNVWTYNQVQGPWREGLVGLPLFLLGLIFVGFQMTWIMYEFYHLKVTKHFCSCASRSQRLSKAARWQLFSQAFLPYGVPSVYGYVLFTGVVNVMACKCLINGGTVTPIACLSWLDFLALPLFNSLCSP